MKKHSPSKQNREKAGIFGLLKPYSSSILGLTLLAIGASGLGLIIPKIISRGIDAYIRGDFLAQTFAFEFGAIALGIFTLTYLQSILQSYASERVAKDLRNTVADRIADQSYEFVEKVTPAKLLTNLTSDVDSIKMFVGQAIASLISSVVIVIGSAILLLSIHWKLALAVLLIVPIIAGLFFIIFSRMRVLMTEAREVIDWLNKVINESILGSSLIRVLNSQGPEFNKFFQANTQSKNVGLKILGLFAGLIPIITFVSNLAMLVILVLGGHFVIGGSMSLGDFTAFNSYVALLIFPILIMGMMVNVLSQAQASYDRIRDVTEAKNEKKAGTLKKDLLGQIEFKNVGVKFDQKEVLKAISFQIKPQTKTAIIGPTAAGKTQLLHLLTRLISPSSGQIKIDDHPIDDYDAPALHEQIGFVFQDSVIFNLSLRKNIAFGGTSNEESLQKAIQTAELDDFIDSLPQGLETIVSERGSSLSGGQKQRIMLARALALNPRILLLGRCNFSGA